ncbi:MAG: HTH domain-containing protein [Fastidiosipilaceae bacterium]
MAKVTTVVVTTNTGTSICWNCKNGRADRCKWISQKKQVWERAEEKKCCHTQSVWTVQKCKHYKPERQQKAPKPQKIKTAGTRWLPEHDALLLELRKKDVSCEVIADKLGRSQGAVYRRIARLKEENHTWAKELVGVE